MMGALFLKMLRTVEVRFAKLPTPLYLRLGLGGLVVGVIALAFPGVWGNGYVMTNRILDGQFDRLAAPWVFGELRGGNWALLAMGGLLFGKLLATVATVSSGAVGGVFTPPEYVLRTPLRYGELCRLVHFLHTRQGTDAVLIAEALGLRERDVRYALLLENAHLDRVGMPCTKCGLLTDPAYGPTCSKTCRNAT